MGAAEFGAVTGGEASQELRANGPIVVTGAGADAKWHSVPENAASRRVEEQLAAEVGELSRSHQAAHEDQSVWQHRDLGPLSTKARRVRRAFRRLF